VGIFSGVSGDINDRIASTTGTVLLVDGPSSVER